MYKYYTGPESLLEKGLTDGATEDYCRHAQRETTSTAGTRTGMRVWMHMGCQRGRWVVSTHYTTVGETELCGETFSINTFDGNFSTWRTSHAEVPSLACSALPRVRASCSGAPLEGAGFPLTHMLLSAHPHALTHTPHHTAFWSPAT